MTKIVSNLIFNKYKKGGFVATDHMTVFKQLTKSNYIEVTAKK